MLNLHSTTSPDWVERVQLHLDDVLLDHAHCEKKAAGTAMNLMFAYPDREDFSRAMAHIVVEELEHFERVLDLLASRGVRYRRLRAGHYGQALHEHVRPQDPQRAVDRLLIAALIEARSCERFALLRDHLADRELAEFYGALFESEARHHATYVRLAKFFAPADSVDRRLEALAAIEAEILSRPQPLVRVHSA